MSLFVSYFLLISSFFCSFLSCMSDSESISQSQSLKVVSDTSNQLSLSSSGSDWLDVQTCALCQFHFSEDYCKPCVNWYKSHQIIK